MSTSIDARFPRKLAFLFKPARYKVARGGRGSGKSWGFARALILRCAERKTRVLCTREIQKSIQQSVHQLLSDQIAALGLSGVFDILQTEIRGPHGSCFYFSGLSDITATTLKSFEGVDIAWCEEAQAISDKSWKTLIPTIRKEGSEIWVTYNPELESDPTHDRFVTNPPPDCVSVVMNYSDNPYFPKVLEAERAHAEATMKDADYKHTWLGQCKPAVDGAIYFDAMAAAIAAGRIRSVPHDGALKTHVIVDLGWNDATTIILAQKVSSEIRIIHYIEGNQRTLADYSSELRALRLDDQPMNWGDVWLPHDGFHVRHQTGKDDAAVLTGLGWSVAPKEGLTMTSINNGINRAREIFPRVYFNEARTGRLVECLKRYRWNISQKTGEAASPLHDEYSHGCLDGDTLVLTSTGNVKIKDVVAGSLVWTPAGFAKVLNSGPTKVATEIIEITMADGAQILATPEHKIFTTKGVVVADALSCTDAIFTKESAPCVSFQGIKSVGYRDAVIESFKASNTGIGKNAASTGRKLGALQNFSILRSILRFTEGLKEELSQYRLMGMSPTPIPETGSLLGRNESANMTSKSSMGCAFTSSQKVTLRQITKSTAESPCTAMFGPSTTETFRPSFTFITKMATKLTTALETLNCFLHLRIQFITQRVMSGLAAVRTRLRYLQQECFQRLGIQAQTELSGIRSTLSKHGENGYGVKLFAQNAVLNTSRHIQADQSIAMPIARLRRLEGAEARRLVYDLTVEKHHCYLANGLLVSNCDAFRYLALASESLSNEAWGAKLNYPTYNIA